MHLQQNIQFYLPRALLAAVGDTKAYAIEHLCALCV